MSALSPGLIALKCTAAPPARWPRAAPATRTCCRGMSWTVWLIGGHRPSTTCSMATCCAGDQDQLQGHALDRVAGRRAPASTTCSVATKSMGGAIAPPSRLTVKVGNIRMQPHCAYKLDWRGETELVKLFVVRVSRLTTRRPSISS